MQSILVPTRQVRGQAGRTVLMYAAECGLDDVAWLVSQVVWLDICFM